MIHLKLYRYFFLNQFGIIESGKKIDCFPDQGTVTTGQSTKKVTRTVHTTIKNPEKSERMHSVENTI